MKTYKCNECCNNCMLVIGRDSRPPRGCCTGQECNATWIEAENTDVGMLKIHNEQQREEIHSLAKTNEDLRHHIEYLKKRYSNLVDWSVSFLGLGVQGIKSITGREVDK